MTVVDYDLDLNEIAVRVINELFSRWGIRESAVTQMRWNLSGDPCSGAAVDSTDFDSNAYNPAIKCDCTFPNSTCHVTRLKVYAMDAVGPIPEGLWSLIYLTNLNLAQNYLTGPLSLSVSLTRMQWMTFGINALSGEVPPELGRLTHLRSLSFGTNDFNGFLPSEIGNLHRLEQLYINSAGLGGQIPSTFANLISLVTLWASDNEFTGRIPEFIGNWTQLQSLRFEGNSFEGSIPPSFSRLTSLQDLRISGLSNGTLDFIMNLKSLTVLSLRNNRISGSIPTDIGDYQNFTHLFLGNNSLSGTLPNVKSATLRNIDLSYNELSGTLPSWVNEANLQLNLVVNNFTLESSGNSGLPSGLNCLQRNFPCDRGSPRYSNFGINCGGPPITSSNRILHEQENEALGASTYYVTSERRWGVSKVGQRDNPRYTASTSRQFTNTLDSELFQTARLSAGSLTTRSPSGLQN